MNDRTEHWQVNKAALVSEAGMVASQHMAASEAGAEILSRGGSAIDAAVATAFALGVVEPWMCGLGGSGYAVIWMAENGLARMVDFQGVLPSELTAEDYPLDPDVPVTLMGFPGVRGSANVLGASSVSVPGAIPGLCQILDLYGSGDLAGALAPAQALCEAGVPVSWFTTLQIALSAADLSQDPDAAALFLPDGHPAQPETRLMQPELAATLQELAKEGAEAFRSGKIGSALGSDLRAKGSRITQDDLADYRVIDAPTLTTEHRGVTLHTPGQTSGGLRLNDFLSHVAANIAPGRSPSPASWTAYAHALNAAWQAHNARVGRATEVGGCTSHLSVVDRQGNMVALTYTLLNRFGAATLSPSTGILLNNAVSYFDPRPGLSTSMAGGKRINASNMCPTIGVRDGDARFAIGASGANLIMPATAQIAALMLDFGLDIGAAMSHPRIDASDRGSVRADPGLGPEVIEALSNEFELEIAQNLVFPKLYACPSGVARDPVTGLCTGMSDPMQPVGGAASP